jgi:phosphatidate cytidylyltransferase
MLSLRLLSGTLLAAGTVAIILLDGWLSKGAVSQLWLRNGLLTTLTLLILTILVAHELIAMAHRAGCFPLRFVCYVFTPGLVVSPYLLDNLTARPEALEPIAGAFWLSLALGVAFWLQAARRGISKAIVNVGSTLLIVLYGGLAAYMVKLRVQIGGWDGAVLLLVTIAVVKITDTGAYFTGRLFGRHKLIPWLSPGKTWEGFAGGLTFAVLLAIGLGVWLRGAGIGPMSRGLAAHWWGMALFGLIMGLASVAGDLCESLLKRDVEMKDAGQSIPGMGGVLDVLDSPLLSAPLAWAFWTGLNLWWRA